MTTDMKALSAMTTDRSLIGRFTSSRSDPSMRFKEEMGYAVQIIESNDTLQKCSPNSIKVALTTIASMGLSLNPERRHAYLIPRRPKAGQPFRCYATPSYLGLEYIARLSGDIANIQTDLVCEKDPVFEQGTDRNGAYVEHEKARGERGEVTHAYCITWYGNGTRHVEVMTRAELDDIKKAAERANNGSTPPSWKFYEGEMQKKAITRRAAKHWPISSSRLDKAMHAMDEADPVDLDRPSGLMMSEKQAEGIRKLIEKLDMDVEREVTNLCAAYGVDELTQINSDRVPAIKRGLNNRAKARGAAA